MRIDQIMIVGISLSVTALADPIRLGSIRHVSSGGGSPQDEARIQLLLEMTDDEYNVIVPDVGLSTWWYDGDDGRTVVYDSTNESHFAELAAALTDTSDDLLWHYVLMDNGGGVGLGPHESQWGLSVPLGLTVDYVNVIAHSISVTLDGTWLHFTVDAEFEFWGTPVPEPAAGLVLMAATLLARRR